MSDKNDLLARWLSQRENTNRGIAHNFPVVNAPQPQNPPNSSISSTKSAENTSKKIPSPLLTGKLADYLAQQPPRLSNLTPHTFTSQDTPWQTEDNASRAAITLAMILTCHLVRFANTGLSTPQLNKIRDDLLKSFNANDAFYLEIEAYELIHWFAAAIDKIWQPNETPQASETIPETSEAALIQIISNAITYQHDLEMKYYTSSSGKFSKRRITPIEITAEKYLIAYCHVRQEERVFRLSRIVTLCPADNASPEAPKLCYPSLTDTALPPLPDTPSTEFILTQSENPTPTSHKSIPHKKSPKTPPQNQTSKQHFSPSTVKKSKSKSKSTPPQPQMRSLFDLDPTPKPAKSPKPKQPSLPGFEKDEN